MCISLIEKDARKFMNKSIAVFQQQIDRVRSNRVSSSFLNDIPIRYNGIVTSLKKISSTVFENPNTLVITVFDQSLVSVVEKSIIEFNLNVNVSSFGNLIRVPFPPLTEERRKDLIKIVRNDAEQGRVSIRNIRRESNDKVKLLTKKKKISKDKENFSIGLIQKLTNEFIKKIDEILQKKENELKRF